MSTERTSCVNALTALLRAFDLGIDARKPLSNAQISQVTAWRTRTEELALSVARTEAVRPANRVAVLDHELADNQNQLTTLLDQSKAAPLLETIGIGPVTAAVVYPDLVPSWPGPQRGSLRRNRRPQPHPRVLGQHHTTPTQPWR